MRDSDAEKARIADQVEYREKRNCDQRDGQLADAAAKKFFDGIFHHPSPPAMVFITCV